jgi:ATP-binding cassette subfamily F protein uup
MGSPNVLLLDEPTNDLDIPTLIALEEYLDDFAGALIVVSHDRYFLDRTIENVFRFEPGGHVREFAGDYSAYLEAIERERSFASIESSSDKQPVRTGSDSDRVPEATEKQKGKKLSFKETRELEALELSIAAAETRLPLIEKELTLAASDAGKVHELFNEQQNLAAQLDIDMMRWAELAERVDG